MNVLTKTSEKLPDGSTEYLVKENDFTLACFNERTHEHPILSRDAFYDNIVTYYTLRKIKFMES